MDRRVQRGPAPFALEEPVNHPLLMTYMAARIRDDLRETFANLAGLNRSSRARRLRLRNDRRARREAAAMAERMRDRTLN